MSAGYLPSIIRLAAIAALLPSFLVGCGSRAQTAASAKSYEGQASTSGSVDGRSVLQGCYGDGRHDDTDCLQQWIDRRQGGTLDLGSGIYLISSALVSAGTITLRGAGGSSGIYQQKCKFGLRTGRPDQGVLILEGAGSRVLNLCIDASVKMTAGVAIRIRGAANSVIIADSHINNQIVSIAISGTGAAGASQNADVVVRHNTIIPAENANAIGIVIGDESTEANTIDTRLEGNSLVCQKGTGTGMLFTDSGGALVQGNTQFGCAIGTKLYPGRQQMLAWMYFSNTVLGDTDTSHDLMIDTGAGSAKIWGLNFVGTWASAASGTSILIQDSARSGNILGVHFSGHRTYMGANQSGIDVRAGQKVTFDAGTICSNGDSTATGFTVRGTAIATAIRNSTIGNCDHNSAGALATGISVETEAQNVGVFSNNDLSTSARKIHWNPKSGSESVAILDGNLGLDTTEVTLASASTITLPPNKTVFLSGSTTVTTMNGGWSNRQVTLYLNSGPVSFAGGGNICNPISGTKNQVILGNYQASLHCWLLK